MTEGGVRQWHMSTRSRNSDPYDFIIHLPTLPTAKIPLDNFRHEDYCGCW